MNVSIEYVIGVSFLVGLSYAGIINGQKNIKKELINLRGTHTDLLAEYKKLNQSVIDLNKLHGEVEEMKKEVEACKIALGGLTQNAVNKTNVRRS